MFKLKKVFDDVPADAVYYDAVMYLYEKGSMIGTGGATFDPDGTLTRGMLVTILWRLSGEPVVNYAMPFTDVPADAYYTEAVRWAAGTGLLTGIPADLTADATRAEAALMVWRITE